MSSELADQSPDSRLALLRDVSLDHPELIAQLDRLANLAAMICQSPIALVSLVQERRQIFIGRSGLGSDATPREDSFCAHAMPGAGPMIVSDAVEDPRFRHNALVTGAPHIRFYAGHPLRSSSGEPLGSFCVIDQKPRAGLDQREREALETLSEAATTLIEKWQDDHRNRQVADRTRNRIAELERRFNVLADSMPQMVWSSPPDGQSDYFNAQWCDFTGQPEEASFGAGWMQFLHPDDVEIANQVWNEAVSTGNYYEVRYRLRRHDGEYRWVVARGLPLHNLAGDVIRWMGTCTDIHDEIATNEKLELLSHELSHRIKNIFAVISGLVSLSMRNNPEIAPLANELHGRIMALGRAHDFVRPSAPGDEEHLGGSSLRGMLERLLEAYDNGSAGRIELSGEDIAIDDRSATPLALFFHELATNSAKHGALSDPDGRVTITLDYDGDWLALNWRDSNGPPVSAPSREGFGSRLIEVSIARQLGGELSFDWPREGAVISARIPHRNLFRA